MLFVAQIAGLLYAAFVCGYLPAAGLAPTSFPSVIFHGLAAFMTASYLKAVLFSFFGGKACNAVDTSLQVTSFET